MDAFALNSRSGTNGTANGFPAAPRATDRSRPGLSATLALELDSVSVFFGSRQIIKNISFEVAPRTVTAIIGPSGSGKSTLVRAMNRLHDLLPDARVEGLLRLFGRDIYAPGTDPIPIRRRIGMVFPKPNVFPTMSIAQNATVGLRLNGLRKRAELDEALERCLRRAALWEEVKDRLHTPAANLSVGEQQRLCVARSLALEPEVLVMDEPASALDPVGAAKVEDLVIDLKKELTVVIVTHNLQQAARLSDYTGFLYLGELVEFGATGKVFTNPLKPQTEAYVTGRFG